MKRLWLALVLAALAALPAWAAGPDATWRGTMQRGAESLLVEVALSSRPGAPSTWIDALPATPNRRTL